MFYKQNWHNSTFEEGSKIDGEFLHNNNSSRNLQASSKVWQGGGDCFSPEMVLGYIYAVLNTTKYREEWAEFLDIDFPRIPFVDDKDEFLRLAKIGFDLVKIHLMEDKTLYEIRKKWKDYGKLEGTNFKVQSPKYDPIDQRFMINETTWLANVPKSVIELKIGAI
jgi:predicted helicase